jgi:hypothetical protein
MNELGVVGKFLGLIDFLDEFFGIPSRNGSKIGP